MAANGFHQGAGKPNWLLDHALPVCLLLLLLAVGGCAQKTLPTVAKLSSAGQDAATQIQTAAVLTDDQLSSTYRAVAFHTAFSDSRGKKPLGSRPLAKANLDHLFKLNKQLVAKTKWLSSLRNSYAALGALAAYDVSGNFFTAYNELSTSTTNFLEAIGHHTSPNVLGDILKYAGQRAVAFVQIQKVIAASKAIQSELDRTIAVLSKDTTKTNYVSLQQEYINLAMVTNIILFKKGVLSIKPMANDIGSLFGTVASANADKIVQGDRDLQSGFCGEIMAIAADKEQEVERNYDKTLDSLRALKTVHAELEAGAQLDLTQVTTIIDQLKAIVTLMTPKTTAKES